jgi:hypothetical protein
MPSPTCSGIKPVGYGDSGIFHLRQALTAQSNAQHVPGTQEDRFRQLLVALCIFGFSQYPCGLTDNPSDLVVKARGEVLGRRLRKGGSVVVDAETKQAILGMPREVIQVAADTCVMICPNPRIARVEMDIPRENHVSAFPLRAITQFPISLLRDVLIPSPAGRHDAGQVAVLALFIGEVANPLRVGRRHVVVEQPGFAHEMGVAGPADFLPMRAVRWEPVIVADERRGDGRLPLSYSCVVPPATDRR